MKEKSKSVRARVLTVSMPISEVGFFNSLIDGLNRIALTRTREKGKGIVDVIASPDRFEELIPIIEGMKEHVKGLEIIGETRPEELRF